MYVLNNNKKCLILNFLLKSVFIDTRSGLSIDKRPISCSMFTIYLLFSMKMSSKKTRGKNFTEQEEDVLLDLVLLNKDILRDKKMDAATWRRKTETWERLTMEFQAKTGTDRSCIALRDKYDNMKKIIRRLKKEKDFQSGVSCRCQNSTMSQNINASPLEDQFESDGKWSIYY